MSDYRTGDRLLVASDALGSKAIRYWLNSEYSHIVPILNADGQTLEIRYPTIHFGNAADYLDGKYRVLHLRPMQPLNDLQITTYLYRAERLCNVVGYSEKSFWEQIKEANYDMKSFWAYLINSGGAQNPQKVNCSEGMLTLDHALGLLPTRSMRFISPQSYMEFLAAGLFEVVKGGKRWE